MNPESRKALNKRLNEITPEIQKLQTEFDKAQKEFDIAKNKRDGVKKLIDNLEIEKQKIKEDINEKQGF